MHTRLIEAIDELFHFMDFRTDSIPPDKEQELARLDAKVYALSAEAGLPIPADAFPDSRRPAQVYPYGHTKIPCARFSDNTISLYPDADWKQAMMGLWARAELSEDPGEGGKRIGKAGGRKGVPQAEAEIRVRKWLSENAKENPAGITRDAVAAGTGVSAGSVSNTSAWKAFKERRDAESKPVPREVPLTDKMEVVMSADCARPDERAALMEEQRKEQEADEKRRHEPS
jgi:hypothetical protein